MKNTRTTGPSQRQLRAGELIRHALAEILQRGDIMDPVLETHVVTVPEVRMSPDLRNATCYVMPLGGARRRARRRGRWRATANSCAANWPAWCSSNTCRT